MARSARAVSQPEQCRPGRLHLRPARMAVVAKRAGVLTGGGDCPGLNAVIRAVARRLHTSGWEVMGVREGWRGLVEGKLEQLGPREVSGILPRGGTILGTSRTNPYNLENGVDRVLKTFRESKLDALVAIGGEDTRRRRAEDDRQRPLRNRLHLRFRHGRGHLHGGHRPPAHDGRVAQPGDGRRGDGPPHRLDRGDERHRRRRGRHPHPGAPDQRRGRVRGDHAPALARQGLLDRRRLRGIRADVRVGRAAPGDAGSGRRRVRARSVRRRRRRARARDRGAHRLRNARLCARARAAGRLAHPA